MGVKLKWLLTLIGTIIVNSSLNSILILNTLSVFILSYLHHFQPFIMLSCCYFILPSCILGIFLSNFLSMIIGNVIQTHLYLNYLYDLIMYRKIMLGLLLVTASLLMFYFTTDIYTYYPAMFISGLGIGFSSLASISNATKFNPKIKRKSNLIISSISSIYSAIFTFICILIINPNNKEPEDRNYFTYAVSGRITTIFLIMLLSIFFLIVISLLLTFQYKTVAKIGSFVSDIINSSEHNEQQQPNIPKAILTTSFYRFAEEEKILNISKKQYQLEKDIIKRSARFWRILALNLFSSFLDYLILNTHMIYGTLNKIEIVYLYYTPIAMSLIASFAHPLFDYISGKISFKILMTIKSILGIGLGISFPFSTKINWTYSLVCTLSVVINSFHSCLFARHIVKVFSENHILLLLGSISGSDLLSNIVSATSAFAISQLFNSSEGLNCLYYLGSTLNGLSLIVLIWESNDVFNYSKQI